MTTAQTASNHVGKTFFGGFGRYKSKSEQRKARRTGLTKYFKMSQAARTEEKKKRIRNRFV